MMLTDDERFLKLIISIEKKLKQIKVIDDSFDNLSSEQETELYKIENKIKKVFDAIWEESNYQATLELWDSMVLKSELADVIEHLR